MLRQPLPQFSSLGEQINPGICSIAKLFNNNHEQINFLVCLGGHTKLCSGLFLALCTGSTPGGGQGTIWGAPAETRISCLPIKCLYLSQLSGTKTNKLFREGKSHRCRSINVHDLVSAELGRMD